MNDKTEVKIADIGEKVTQIHTFMFGHDGQGGLNRSVESLKAEVKALQGFRSKVAGMGAAIGLLGGVLGAKISKVLGL